tara:strand:- start:128 stop:709 length:582 start_codon:yes stop_codon:yes gene_type:complete
MKTKRGGFKALNTIKNLCTPALVYLVLSTLSFLGLLSQNCANPNSFTVGNLNSDIPCNNALIFVTQILYIIIFTFLLDMLCKKGYTTISWILLFFPLIAMFGMVILFTLFFISISRTGKEGVGDFGSIQRMQKGQIKGGITGDDLYLVQKDKDSDIEKENVKLKKLEDEKKKKQEEQLRKAEEKAGFTSSDYF